MEAKYIDDDTIPELPSPDDLLERLKFKKLELLVKVAYLERQNEALVGLAYDIAQRSGSAAMGSVTKQELRCRAAWRVVNMLQKERSLENGS